MKRRIVAVILALSSFASAQCDVYNSSVDVKKDEFGVFIQDRIGCALSNLMSPGTFDSILVLFFIFMVLLILYGLMSKRF